MSDAAAEAAPLRIAFFGSPAYAVPAFERLQERHQVVLVVTQPDAPAGRGMRVHRCPVARAADAAGLPVVQPTRLRSDRAFLERLRAAELSVAITVAYGRILPETLLRIPRHGFLNAHASLLPELRGAAPIQHALMRGYRRTGVTVMETDAGMDTGPIRLAREVAIADDEGAIRLSARLSHLSADLLTQALDLLVAGRLPREPQDDERATYAPLLRKEDGDVRWRDPARAVIDRHRGVEAWPKSRFRFRDAAIQAGAMRLVREHGPAGPPGRVLAVDDAGVQVACGEGVVALTHVTPPGRSTVAADAWAHGARLKEGDDLA